MPPILSTIANEERVLIFVDDDAVRSNVCALLAGAGVHLEQCPDLPSLCKCIAEGAATVVINQGLSDSDLDRVRTVVAHEPPWSDLPILVLTDPEASDRSDAIAMTRHDRATNVILLDHPTRPLTMVNTVLFALRSRRRQFEVRDKMTTLDARETELERVEDELRELNNALERRVTERTNLIRLSQDIAVIANTASTVNEAIQWTLPRIGGQIGWHAGQAYLRADDNPGLYVHSRVWWKAPGKAFPKLQSRSRQTVFTVGQGILGRVVETGQPYWTSDVRHDTTFARNGDGDDLGVRSLAASPITVGRDIVGVLEFFSDERVEVNEDVLDTMSFVGTQLGRVVERKAFEKQLADQVAQEHQRIGQELHDNLGQLLTGIATMAQSLTNRLQSQGVPEADRSRVLMESITEAQHQVRSLARGLNPVEVDARGLMTALEALVEASEQWSGVECDFVCDEPVTCSDNATATHLYRIAQEAISNAFKHGSPSRVMVALHNGGDQIVLSIQDNGIGLKEAESDDQRKGLGMRIMKHRAEMIGADLTFESGSQEGTTVSCRVWGERR